uniref:Uncharacterized protein n=1 Tax=Plectus sambesii TaxID=2011161 RepID=A0A914VJQ4_9BILA
MSRSVIFFVLLSTVLLQTVLCLKLQSTAVNARNPSQPLISRFRRSADAELADAEAMVDNAGNQKQCVIEVQVVSERANLYLTTL